MSKFDENFSVKELAQQVAQEIGQQMGKQIAQQIASEVGQQQAKQIEQAVAQGIQAEKQGIQGSSQEKTSVFKEEEINAGEGHRSGVLSLTRAWNNEDLTTKQRSNDLENARAWLAQREAEHNFAVQRKLDHETVRGARNAITNDNQLAQEYAKFNSAVSEPLAPNTQDSGSDTKGGDQA